MEISGFGASDIGCRRERNEDSYLINSNHNLYVVADGMGGHLGGEYASKLATATLEEVISDLSIDPDITLQSDMEVRPGDYKGYLKYSISVASMRIYEKSANDPSLHGMGTTIVALMFAEGKAYYANVGDSRCYLVRAGKIKQLTEDHSLVGEQLRAGVIKPAEVKNHKLKNIITRSVGFQEDVDVDVNVKPVKVGDKFVLCSDGLSNMVPNEDMVAVVSELSPKDACNQLIELANKNGGDDNITVVVAEILSTETVPQGDEDTIGL